MLAASAASRSRRRALAAPRSTSLTPTSDPRRARARPPRRMSSSSRRGRVGSGTSARRLVVAGVEQRARVATLELRLTRATPAPATAARRAGRARARRGGTACGRLRSQRASPALASAVSTEPGGQRLEHVLDDVLGGQALDQRGLLQPDRGLVGDRPQQLRVVSAKRPAADHAGEDAELLVAGHERGDQQAVVVQASTPSRPACASGRAGARRGPGAAWPRARRAGPTPPAPARRPRHPGARSGRRRRPAAAARRA